MASRKDVFQEKYVGKDYVARGVDLILDKEVAWKKISRRARRAIDAARSLPGLRIEKKKGTKEELDLFRTIWYDANDSELGDGAFRDDQHVYFCYLNDEFVAGVIVTEVDSNLFLHYNGATDEAKKLQIPSLMIWHIVEEFHGSRFKYLDVGCSFRKSLQDFFENWKTHEYPLLMNPPYYLPKIDLSPFDNASLSSKFDVSANADEELKKRFSGRPFTYFPAGKYALYAILKHLNLAREDEVFISTTTGSPYISSCVTTAIEAVCNWNRQLSDKTKAILVIHEFGFINPEVKQLKELVKQKNIILIEDCAYAWKSGQAGQFGDYVIYSLPKFFPMQYGGLLLGVELSDELMWSFFRCLDVGKREIIRKQLPFYLKDEDIICRQRIENYQYLENLFKEEGYETLFSLSAEETPAVFILKLSRPGLANKISSRCDYFGIECGIFHHNDAVFLPCHQNLSQPHLDYIFGVVKAGLRKDGWVVPPEEIIKKREKPIAQRQDAEKRWRANK